MRHKKKHQHPGKKKKQPPAVKAPRETESKQPRLEVVVKCDTAGCTEVVCETLQAVIPESVDLEIIYEGVGDISKNDITLAETGSRLIVGFNVEVLPKITDLCREHNIEVRLYEVIYHLSEDIRQIALSLVPHEDEEEILGTAEVIALFKSCRGGIILGCQVRKGRLQLGDSFRIISAVGTVYKGKIVSLHIEKDAVTQAIVGKQVGLKITDFNKAKIGDIVESFFPAPRNKQKPWIPKGKVIHI